MMKWLAGLIALSVLGVYGLYNCIFCFDKGGRAGSAPGREEIVLRLPSWPMQGLDPIVWRPELVILQGTIAEGLFGYDQELNVIPKVTKTWEMSEDKQTWTFHLRTDKRWSNGDPVRADDFIFAWTRFCSPEVPSETWASMFPSVEKAMDFKGTAAPIDSVGFRAVDDSTIVIRLMRPKALPSLLAMGSAMPINRKAFEAAKAKGEVDFWYMPGNFVGNGPYVTESFVRDGEVVLVKNPHYVGQRGNVDRFILKAMSMSSQNVQIQQYEAGELDLAQVLTLGDFAYASKAKHLKPQLSSTPEIGYLGLQVAHTVNKLMTDENLRKAIALAIDRDDIAKNVMGGRVSPTFVYGTPTDTLFKTLKTQPRDVAEAKRLLAKSSYKGEVIYLFAPPATDVQGLASVCEAIQSQLKEIGLNVVIENLELDLLTGVLASYIWGGGYLDDARYTRPGLTLFPGKMLWKEPVFLVRGTDCIWYWMNFDYELKQFRKQLTLQRVNIKNEDKGDKPEHWTELKGLADTAHAWFARIRKEELDTLYGHKVAESDPFLEFERARLAVTPKTPKAEAISKWQAVKERMIDAQFNYAAYLQNRPNLDGNRLLANLETMTLDDPKVPVLAREFLQMSLDQDWIVPLVSENLVYLKKPFLKGEALYKFGVWNMVFNLQYIEVDEPSYFGRDGKSDGNTATAGM